MALTSRELAARRRMFRRRRAGVLLVLVLIVLAIVIVPRIAAAARAAGVQADLDGLVGVAEGAVEASSALTAEEATAALADARTTAAAASDDAREDAVATLASAVEAYRSSAVTAAQTVLRDWSDAEKSTEDDLYRAAKALSKADTADLVAALGKTATAAESVRASAQAYRDGIAAAAATTSSQPTGGDVDAQVAYLRAHATDYDVEQWGDYNPAGGDCVNFASQGLLARGWRMDGTWSSTGPWGASKAWRDTAAMDDYLSAQGFSFSTMADLDRVRMGDVGVFDWGDDNPGLDHTMTVSDVKYSPSGPILSFASHNTDGADRPLPKVLSESGSGASVRIYSIP